MKFFLFITAFALAWYFIGVILIGIVNFFDAKSISYPEWEEWQGKYYLMAAYGPILIIVFIGFGIYKMFKYLHIHLLSTIFDWIIVGFRKPPVPPTIKTEESPDFPTVSP